VGFFEEIVSEALDGLGDRTEWSSGSKAPHTAHAMTTSPGGSLTTSSCAFASMFSIWPLSP
jgi:hypothetical protein